MLKCLTGFGNAEKHWLANTKIGRDYPVLLIEVGGDNPFLDAAAGSRVSKHRAHKGRDFQIDEATTADGANFGRVLA